MPQSSFNWCIIHLVQLGLRVSSAVRLIKDAVPFIVSPLTHIFNLSLEMGKFPDALKIAKVTPLYKHGSNDDPGNYRPISVLPVIAKVFEKLVNGRLMDFL